MKKLYFNTLIILMIIAGNSKGQNVLKKDSVSYKKPADLLFVKRNLRYAAYVNYSYYQFRDNDSVHISRFLGKDGVSGIGVGGSVSYIFPSRKLSAGVSADVNYIPARYRNGQYPWESEHYLDYVNYDTYINNYEAKYKEIPISLNAKFAIFPLRTISPFCELGICVKYISFEEKGIYNITTPYSAPFNMPIDHKFIATSSCFKPAIGVSFKASKHIQIFGKVSYLKPKFEEKFELYKHTDVVYTQYPYNSPNSAMNAFKLVFPQGYYEGWLFSFGVAYTFGKPYVVKQAKNPKSVLEIPVHNDY